MGLVDDVRGYAARAGDAIKQGAGAAKDRAREMSLGRKRSALSADLGQIVYRQREGETGLDAEIERLTAEIRAVDAEIEALHDD